MPHFRQRRTRAVLLSGLMLAGTTPATAQTVADYQALRNTVDELQRRLDTVQRALTAKEPRETPPVMVVASPPATGTAAQQQQGPSDPLPRPAGAPSVLAQGGPSALPAGYGFRIGETNFRISGFIKGDLIFSRYGDGDTATNPLGRELSLPQSIPVGGRRSGILADASAKQSRIAFQTATPIGEK